MRAVKARCQPSRLVILCLVFLSSRLLAAATPIDSPTGEPAPPTLRWWTLDAGGGPVANLGIELDASIGQPDVYDDQVLQQGSLQLRPGYWGPGSADSGDPIFSDGFEATN